MDLHHDYWDEPALKQQFIHLTQEIHNLDLTLWDEMGFWDDRYRPFSLFDQGRIISTLCLYEMQAIIHGESQKIVQISAVATVPDHRKQGLNRDLTKRALELATPHAGLILFADDAARGYYENTGFRPLRESLATITPTQTDLQNGNLSKLDLRDTKILDDLYQRVQRRAAPSQIFSIQMPRLFMFHVLYTMRDCCYAIPDLDCVVLIKRDGEQLIIYDILADQIPPWEALAPHVMTAQTRSVHFHLYPEQLSIPEWQELTLEGSSAYTRGSFPLDAPIFPFTGRA